MSIEQEPVAMREIPTLSQYKKGDVLVLFGELFSLGYVNGLVDAAKKREMTIVHSTVGRRDPDGSLRKLNQEEYANIPQPFINIPLEAGFDMEPSVNGVTPCDQLSGIKIKEWESAKLDWQALNESKEASIKRFRKFTTDYMSELKRHIPKNANVLFVHMMAGGVPRAKILMPTMNKVFKGRGDRFIASKDFWNSDIGKLCDENFNEVTANTFQHLVELSSEIRNSVEDSGCRTRYVAYGYHGTEILIGNEYQWQSYAPYVQGWAKVLLEKHAINFHKEGISCTVYNCPEILTNSSSIFLGVEVCLYPIMKAFKKEYKSSEKLNKKLESLKSLLKPEHSIDEILEITEKYLQSETIKQSYNYSTWPQHNTKSQMELMLDTSSKLIDMHSDKKDLITYKLSRDVFTSTGALMLDDSWEAAKSVQWLNHDVIAKQIASSD